MKFKKIRFKNFLSFGNTITEIDLDSNQSILITGENGTGKTTALEAFYFAICGKPYRKIKKDELINSTNKKELYVEVEFNHENHEYIIKRGIKPNLFELYQDNKLIDLTASTKDYQTILENLIGVDSDTFANTIFISSKCYTPFLKLKAEDKRNFIENVLNIKTFSQILDETKIKRTLQTEKHNEISFNLKNSIDKFNIAKESNETYAKNNEDEIESIKKLIDTEETTLIPINDEISRIEAYLNKNKFDAKLVEIFNEQNNVHNEINSATQAINDDTKLIVDKHNDEISLIRQQISAENKKQIVLISNKSALEKQFDMLSHEHTNTIDKLKQILDKEIVLINNEFIIKQNEQASIIDKNNKAIEFYQHNTECPTCKQIISLDSDIISKHVLSLKTEIERCNRCIEVARDSADERIKHITIETQKQSDLTNESYISKKEDVKFQLFKINEDIRKIEDLVVDLNAKIINVEPFIKKAEAEKQIKIAEMLKEFDDKINNLQLKKQDIESKIKQASNKSSELLNKKTTSDTKINSFNDRIKELSSIEKKSLIDTVPLEKEIEINKEELNKSDYEKETIAELIKILSDKGIKTYIIAKYIPYLNELVNKYLEIFNANYRLQFDSNFDIQISGRGYEKLGYYSFSSGEEQRVDLALLFSFYELGKMKNSINTNVLMLDEISDKSLDSDGLSGLFSIFKNMKQKGMTIFNISHRPEVRDKFDKVYKITKTTFSSITEE